MPSELQGHAGTKKMGNSRQLTEKHQTGAMGVAVPTQPKQALPQVQWQESSWPPGRTAQIWGPVPCQ